MKKAQGVNKLCNALAALLALSLHGGQARAEDSGKGRQKELCRTPENTPDCAKCGQSSRFDGGLAARCPAECQAPKDALDKFRQKYCKQGNGGAGQASGG